jgi:hypothetical protein
MTSETRTPDHAGRPEPPPGGDEIETLTGYLERARATFAWKCGGLDASALRVTVGASTMTLGGMLLHLARFEDDMAEEWLNGRPQLPRWAATDWESDPDADWREGRGMDPAEVFATWQASVERTRAALATAAGEGGPGRRVTTPGGYELPSLRYILVNMIEEYARHNGHADLIREVIDGRVGLDPPEA